VSEFVKQKNMEIVFDTNVEENLLSFDLDNMERIILNLLSNAIKFNSEDGIIEVTIQCDDEVKISVKDQGIGIPKEKIDNIFDRFEQVEDKFKKNKEGSGIGLSLVKSLVTFHHGSVSVNSEIGKGSEFIVTLPNVIRTDIKHEEKINTYNNVNMMRVEFSDIYS
ncbi:MAG: sensor histidine kinase, partial [Peptostreptococcaceae bacterium]